MRMVSGAEKFLKFSSQKIPPPPSVHLHNAFCLTIWTGSVRHGCLATYGFHGSFEYIMPASYSQIQIIWEDSVTAQNLLA